MRSSKRFEISILRRPWRNPVSGICFLGIAFLSLGTAANGQVDFTGSQVLVDYPNRLYPGNPVTPTGILNFTPPAVAFFGGHVDDPDAATPGLKLIESSFGQPIEGTVFTQPDFLIGEEITPPDLGFSDAIVLPPVVSPASKAFWVSHAGKLFANEVGFVEVQWNLLNPIDNTSHPMTENYSISSLPFEEPVPFYHTRTAQGGATGAPPVDLSTIPPYVTIHHNSKFFRAADPINSPLRINSDFLEAEAPKTGLVVLEINRNAEPSATDDFIGIQIVDVRAFAPANLISVTVTDQLLPQSPIVDGVTLTTPVIAGGLSPLDGGDPYLYQNKTVLGNEEDHIWCVRPSSSRKDFSRMKVLWMQSVPVGDLGISIEWPYDLDFYSGALPEVHSASVQLYVRGDPDGAIGPSVDIPDSLGLNPHLNAWQDPPNHAELNGTTFHTDGPGWSILRYELGDPPGFDEVRFEIVRSVEHDDTAFFDLTSVRWPIGTEITDASHQISPSSKRGGYIHVEEGDKYDPEVYAGEREEVFAVNTGPLEIWWRTLSAATNVSDVSDVIEGVQWPSKVVRYNNQWPTSPEEIVIASGLGTGDVTRFAGRNHQLYFQNEVDEVGFNPNNEHAVMIANVGYPLRYHNRGGNSSEDFYVLLKYEDDVIDSSWEYEVFSVIVENATYDFEYDVEAGNKLVPPKPLGDLGLVVSNNVFVSSSTVKHFFKDRNDELWAMAGPDDGNDVPYRIQAAFYYPDRPEFYFPPFLADFIVNASSEIPFLSQFGDQQIDISYPKLVEYDVTWPDTVPELRVGETLHEAKFGLPQIAGQCSVDVIYQQATRLDPDGEDISVQAVDLTKEHRVPLTEQLPSEINTEPLGAEVGFPDLPPHLASRFTYNPSAGDFGEIIFRGLYEEPDLGLPFFLPNVFSDREKGYIQDLDGTVGGAFDMAVGTLQMLAADDLEFTNDEIQLDTLSLSAGVATAPGYVVLALQNNETFCDPGLPVDLVVLKVTCPLDKGEIAPIPAACFFDEKFTLKHKNDFAGNTDDYKFEWRWVSDVAVQDAGSGTPCIPDCTDCLNCTDVVWQPYESGPGLVDITIGGPNRFTLSTNWFTVRYKPASANNTICTENDGWSEWAPPNIAEGWITRVQAGLNPFDQRFKNLADPTRTVNTQVTMLTQAGPRWEGAVPLNCDAVDEIGLIEAYETVYQRAVKLSIDAPMPINDPGVNNELLKISSKLADLYGLLGNEAYADANDPTISFGINSDETFLAAVTSIHAFENMTSSLIEEELALLRGRDAQLAPSITTLPVYNRLVWNFSRDLGEVAYALNYDIQDSAGNADGFLTETDAKRIYPQGHGDAWGHHLTAITNYYRLLQDQDFDWVPRAESILIGGAATTVDFVDEQRLIRRAAARARTGAQIVSLTHRQNYSEDPSEQWKGYKDSDPVRAWGLAEWGSRAGQAALIDWVVGNAILPEPVEGAPINITKIDRRSMTDLRELASQGAVIQAEVDKADLGLNPIGLATNVMPFDIDPAAVDEGMTHYEQIYERAIMALSNAATVFLFANDTTQQLRRQADSLEEHQRAVNEQEADYRSQFIEIFGTPYEDDIGPAGTYPTGYIGPDIYHYDYVEPSQLRDEFGDGTFNLPIQEFAVNFLKEPFQFGDGISGVVDLEIVIKEDSGVADAEAAKSEISFVERDVTYTASSNGLGLVKPEGWGQRETTGQLQETRSEMLQLYAEYRMALSDYTGLVAELKETVALVEARFEIRRDQIKLRTDTGAVVTTMDVGINVARLAQFSLEAVKDDTQNIASAFVEAQPRQNGTSNDVTSVLRAGFISTGAAINEGLDIAIGGFLTAELAAEFSKTQTELWNDIAIETLEADLELKEALLEIQNLVRNEETLRYDLYGRAEALRQSGNAYKATLAEGYRILEDFYRFRVENAADIQEARYKDMAFRIIRDDLLQKYRGQFDLAAKFVYLAARAYDFETGLLESDARGPGQDFLTEIVRSRAIGVVQDNDGDGVWNPETAQSFGDPGLADIMSRMNLNWNLALKSQLGFNNPQPETNTFSLRNELFRTVSDASWETVLKRHVVDNVLTYPEFERFARPFFPQADKEPAIVIPFSTQINAGANFFGHELIPGDSAYNSSNFATKVRNTGVLFSGFENANLADDPQVYLIPVGEDILRSPSGDGSKIRKWNLLDQVMPVPFPVSAAIQNDPSWIPSDQLVGQFGDIRRYSSFKAFPDTDDFEPDEFTTNSRIIGRSVWNTRWVLIIPFKTMLFDTALAKQRFIENVDDISLVFQSYAYSGNKKKSAKEVAND